MQFEKSEILLSSLTVNIRRCEDGDTAEWERARRVQDAIDRDLIEYDGYDAGICAYKITRLGLNVRDFTQRSLAVA